MLKKGYNQNQLNKMHKNGYYNHLCSDEFYEIYNFISKKIIDTKLKSVLDVGCWNGMFLNALEENGYNKKYLGFDLSSSAIDEAIKKYKNKNFKFITNSWNNISILEKYDAIYFGGVFYYIDDKENFLNSYIKQCKPKIIFIQDLQNTNLNFLNTNLNLKYLETFYFEINIDKNEARKKRQIKIFYVKDE
jgi:2-polyprenyl-3-methyl-5-hydroxy-6-metoxy-1,4-benzoquinol methylase